MVNQTIITSQMALKATAFDFIADHNDGAGLTVEAEEAVIQLTKRIINESIEANISE